MSQWQQLFQYCKKFFCSSKGISSSIAVGAAFTYLMLARKSKYIPEVRLSYFLLALQENLISEIVLDGLKIIFRCFNGDVWYCTNATIFTRDQLYKIFKQKPEITFTCTEEKRISGDQLFYLALVSASLSYAAGLYLSNYSPFSKSANNEKGSQVRFEHIYGLDHAKKQLFQIIDYLSDPNKFKHVGARLRRGAMIYGPPGTGKTMLAKATANESQVKFLYCSATEFMEVYVGMGAKRVRELFEKAYRSNPCIIFIDEIDSIAYKRYNSGSEVGSESERINTLNQLLTELDGFKENENIVVIAATNRISILDDALMRSGRFDIKIQINMPNEEDRLGIMKVHLQNKRYKISDDLLQEIANKTEGYSGADMENITNEAAYITIEKNKDLIDDQDLLESFKKIKLEKEEMQNFKSE